MFHLLHWQFNGHENTLPSPSLPPSRNYGRCQTWCHRRDLPRFILSPLIKTKRKKKNPLILFPARAAFCRVGSILLRMRNFHAKLRHIHMQHLPIHSMTVHRESGTVWKVQIESCIPTDFAYLPIHIHPHCISPPPPHYVLIQTVDSGAGEGQILARLHGCMRQKRIGINLPLKTGNSFACSDVQLKLGLRILNKQLVFFLLSDTLQWLDDVLAFVLIWRDGHGGLDCSSSMDKLRQPVKP